MRGQGRAEVRVPEPGAGPRPTAEPGQPPACRAARRDPRDPPSPPGLRWPPSPRADRKSTRLNSSHLVISYAVFCLKKKNSSLSILRLRAFSRQLSSAPGRRVAALKLPVPTLSLAAPYIGTTLRTDDTTCHY